LVTSDASDYAIGAMLSQDPVNQARPIASKILCKAEQNYNTKELLAIVWTVKYVGKDCYCESQICFVRTYCYYMIFEYNDW